MSLSMVRPEFKGFAKGRSSLVVELPSLQKREAKVEVPIEVFRLELDALPVLGNGLFDISFSEENVSQTHMGSGMVRLEFNGLAKGRSRLIELPSLKKRQAKVEARVEIHRLELDTLPVLGNGLFEISFLEENVAQTEMGIGMAGLEFNRPTK